MVENSGISAKRHGAGGDLKSQTLTGRGGSSPSLGTIESIIYKRKAALVFGGFLCLVAVLVAVGYYWASICPIWTRVGLPKGKGSYNL